MILGGTWLEHFHDALLAVEEADRFEDFGVLAATDLPFAGIVCAVAELLQRLPPP